MEELCLKLKQDLENYFSMPFEIQPVFKDGEVHYVCSPYNEDQMYFSVEVYIHNKIRLVIEIYPQKHGGYILNEMAHAPEEKQSTFFSYKQMLVDKGLKSCYSVNKSDLLENKWPITWRTFDFKMTKIPIPDNVNECESILVELVRYSFELIFSLLTITDISEEEFLQKAVQTEGTIQEIKSIRYERIPINRKLCLYKKGYTCAVCGMNFQDVYGDIGKGFIEVHHTTPVSKMGEGYNLDIERDLVPLCSNCHSMTHRRNPPYSVEELKEIIKLK